MPNFGNTRGKNKLLRFTIGCKRMFLVLFGDTDLKYRWIKYSALTASRDPEIHKCHPILLSLLSLLSCSVQCRLILDCNKIYIYSNNLHQAIFQTSADLSFTLTPRRVFVTVYCFSFVRADSRFAPSQWETSLQITPSPIGWAQT